MSWFKSNDEEYLGGLAEKTEESVAKNVEINFIDGNELTLQDCSKELDEFTKWYADKNNDTIFVFHFDDDETYYFDKKSIMYLYVY